MSYCQQCADLLAEVSALKLLLTTANEKLARYEFEESAHVKEAFKKTFHAEIAEAHPLVFATGKEDWVSYNLALKLVSERHSKYELVDLVNWLLIERKKVQPTLICSWCQKTLSQGCETKSHGICQECKDKEFPTLKKQAESTQGAKQFPETNRDYPMQKNN